MCEKARNVTDLTKVGVRNHQESHVLYQQTSMGRTQGVQCVEIDPQFGTLCVRNKRPCQRSLEAVNLAPCQIATRTHTIPYHDAPQPIKQCLAGEFVEYTSIVARVCAHLYFGYFVLYCSIGLSWSRLYIIIGFPCSTSHLLLEAEM
jgi:hypothetical protein